jgi:hypothetical protein
MSNQDQIRAARARRRIAQAEALVREMLTIADRLPARIAERPEFSEADLYDESGFPA